MTLRADLAKQAYLARILTRFANEEWNSIPKAVFEFYPTNHPNRQGAVGIV